MDEHAEDALYREVWEEVHAQKTYDFVKKNMRLLIIAAILILMVVVGIQIVMKSNHNARARAAAEYETALSITGSPEAMRRALEKVAENNKGGMADLATFQAAKLELQTGSKDKGIALLEQLAKRGTSRDFRDLAIINLAGLRGDSMKGAEFEKFMAPLQSKRSPFYYSGMLLIAQKYLSEDNAPAANVWLDRIISDPNAPASIAGQAQILH